MRAPSFNLLRFFSVFRILPALLFNNPFLHQLLCRIRRLHMGMEGEELLFLLGSERADITILLRFAPRGA